MMKIILYTSLIVPIVLLGCQPLQIIPGLCYTDKKGTYLCEPAANSQQHEVPTSYEPENPLICMEEQDHGVFIDVCKGVVIIPINIEDEQNKE